MIREAFAFHFGFPCCHKPKPPPKAASQCLCRRDPPPRPPLTATPPTPLHWPPAISIPTALPYLPQPITIARPAAAPDIPLHPPDIPIWTPNPQSQVHQLQLVSSSHHHATNLRIGREGGSICHGPWRWLYNMFGLVCVRGPHCAGSKSNTCMANVKSLPKYIRIP